MTTVDEKSITILMADDDLDDLVLAREALIEGASFDNLRTVTDGEELMDYLCRRGKFADEESAPKPDLILLDLNMPRKDGREALVEIKRNPDLGKIPVIVFTTSGEENDIRLCYASGANSYVKKPSSFDSLVEVMKSIAIYWLKIVRLPAGVSPPVRPRIG